jgi:predicted dehydrogenase
MARRRISRRHFLWTSAALGTAAIATPAFLKARSPNNRLNVALIGVGGQGGYQFGDAKNLENVVAICDIDENILDHAGSSVPSAKRFFDYRKMLEEMEKQIDAVMVSTPDHNHAPASAMAMRMGKHCYCEKPLTHTVDEARVLAGLAKEKNLVTQMGTQIHAGDNYRRAVEIVQAGMLGPITEVKTWCPRNWSGGKRPTDTPPVPPTIHWDEWIGPAAMRPYNPCYLPMEWRRWWAFGNGTMGDMACHIMDVVFWALKLRHPTSIEAKGPPVDAENTPNGLFVQYEFPALGNANQEIGDPGNANLPIGSDAAPPLRLTWNDGVSLPEFPKGEEIPIDGIGALFIGKEGMLRVDYETYTLYPKEKFKDFKAPPPSIPSSIGHHAEFFEACKTGGPTTCNFDYSGALTEAVLLGSVAYKTGEKILWDGPNLKVTNSEAAQKLIAHEYRDGWKL